MTWKILIITEGSMSIGFGHIVRCCAIANEAIKRDCNVAFLANADFEAAKLINKYDNVIMDWLKLETLVESVIDFNPDIVIIDSYLASKYHYQKVSELVSSLVIIDDNNDFRYSKGHVVNPSLYGGILNYPDHSQISYGIGHEHVILREIFNEISNRIINDDIKDILITFGGTDILNFTPNAIYTVREIFPQANIHVVTNKSKFSNIHQVYLYKNLNGEQMYNLMNKCDIAISAAGQTIYELIATRTPFICIQVADNQSNNLKSLKENKLANIIDNIEDLSQACLEMRSKEYRQQYQVEHEKYNFKGAQKIITAGLINAINIQKLNKTDIEDVYHLSNDEAVRKWSINQEPILYENHIEWFYNILNDENVLFYSFKRKKDNVFLGQVRISCNENKGLISISLNEQLRGKRIAKTLVNKFINKIQNEYPNINIIEAQIHKENIPSLKLFNSLGFSLKEEGNPFNRYQLILKNGRIKNENR
ncbi:bifunctional UDP-2,4-diacetamido-2,4,6-trideoxy-beta-L-altropyranose hydrolase/GNAT family N-acetyltransferase [Bacillus sp. JJ1122]|uniref:bifunctional UDP-2,4-diacetamido-2,4,6-trideoxy-beta-L-altropyranose hydrolase/GNAT family N-acetyltransferase n=1 Tax=Bacillus sp. JJ1122 TaxID=3122951 RepID=UPI002FFDB1A8